MDRLLTKTLAEIYLEQGHLQEAYLIFKALSEKNPSDAELQSRVRELEERLGSLPPKQQLTLEEKQRTLEKWLANIRDRRTS
jgi:predicted Zn-dependent protease